MSGNPSPLGSRYITIPVQVGTASAMLRGYSRSASAASPYVVSFTNYLSVLGRSIVGVPVVVPNTPLVQVSQVGFSQGLLSFFVSGGQNGLQFAINVSVVLDNSATDDWDIWIQCQPNSPNTDGPNTVYAGAPGPSGTVALAALPPQTSGNVPVGGFWRTPFGSVQQAPVCDLTRGNLADLNLTSAFLGLL
jgi:hypothetical protein